MDKKLSDFSIASKQFSFPGIDDAELSVTDYADFLKRLQLKLKENNTVLDKLLITPCTIKALDGLTSFSTSNKKMHINKLELDIAGVKATEVDDFLAKLKTILQNLSASDLKLLTLEDSKELLTEEHWKQIAAFVAARKIAVELLLPPKFAHTPIQRAIDQSVSTNKFTHPKTAPVELPDTAQEIQKKGKRTRPRLDNSKNLNVEIELQQEQAVEVAVSREKLTLGFEEETNTLGSIILYGDNFDNFFTGLEREHFNIGPQFYLCSESTLKNIWNTWFGHLEQEGKISFNNHLSGISEEACEQLLINHRHFQNGIDLEHLAPGFVLMEFPLGTGEMVLYYDKNKALIPQKADPLALVVEEELPLKPLAFPLFEKLIKILAAGTASEKLIAAQWEKLSAVPYDRQAIQSFQLRLPALSTLKKEQLQTLFALCFDKENRLNKEKFDFLLSHMGTIAQLFTAKGFDESIQPAAKKLTSVFGSPEEANQAVALAIAVKQGNFSNVSNESQLLTKLLLQENPELLKKIQTWKQETQNTLSYDALLHLYSQKGIGGLNQLLAQWENNKSHLATEFVRSYFSSTSNYEVLLEQPWKDALAAISGFSGAKKDWWNALYSKHVSAVGASNLPALVESFKQFSNAIEKKGLTFKQLPPHSFEDVKSMPVALGRMLTILNQCPAVDVKEQWEIISLLSFDSSGAIRVVTDAEKVRGESIFVSQELRADKLESSKEWRDIGSKNTPEDLKQEFLLNIVHQRHRLSIGFYHRALQLIVEKPFTQEVKSKLAALLVASTTGLENKKRLEAGGEEAALKLWVHILGTAEKIPLPSLIKKIPTVMTQAQQTFVSQLYDLRIPPELPILYHLTNLVANSIKIETSNPLKVKQELTQKAASLKKVCSHLELILRHFDDAIYEGMRFYGEEAYKPSGNQRSVFYSHVETALAVIGFTENAGTLFKTTNRELLLRLISTFHIDAIEAKKLVNIAEAVPDSFAQGELFTDCLKLLTKIQTNTSANKKLNTNDLTELMVGAKQVIRAGIANNNSEETIKADVVQYIQKTIGNYFAPDFFTKLQATEIPPDVRALINKNFTDDERKWIALILDQFRLPGDASNFKKIVQKIVTIVGSMTAVERRNFLNTLAREDLYQLGKHNPKKKIEISQFSSLLDAILDRGQANDFIYLLAQKESLNSDGLLTKAIYYLGTILPGIEKNKVSGLAKTDVLPLVAQILLNSPELEVNGKSVGNRQGKPELELVELGLESFMSIFSDKDVTNFVTRYLDQLQAQLAEFKANIPPGFDSLDKLITQLKELNKPQILVTEVEKPKEKSSNKSSIPNTLSSYASGFVSWLGKVTGVSEPEPEK